jgi:hypothetical protein
MASILPLQALLNRRGAIEPYVHISIPIAFSGSMLLNPISPMRKVVVDAFRRSFSDLRSIDQWIPDDSSDDCFSAGVADACLGTQPVTIRALSLIKKPYPIM